MIGLEDRFRISVAAFEADVDWRNTVPSLARLVREKRKRE
jgi:hypothetical protein